MIDRESWERYSTLLDEALELDAAGRAQWLELLRTRDAVAAAALSRMLARLKPAAAADTPITCFGDLLNRTFDHAPANPSRCRP